MNREAELEIEVAALRDRIKALGEEVYTLKKIIKENDFEMTSATMSDEERICVNEISNLKQLSDSGLFTKNEAIILDLLYKNLRIIRGLSEDKSGKKQKKADVTELFKIIEGSSVK